MLNPYIDAATARLTGLEYIFGLIRPGSPYGQAALQTLQPFAPERAPELNRLLQLQSQLLAWRRQSLQPWLRLEHNLAQLVDWRPALQRLQAGATLDDVELFRLKQLLYYYQEVQHNLQDLPLQLPFPALGTDFADLLQLLDPDGSRTPSFYIADSYSARLAHLRRELRHIRRRRQTYEQEQERLLTEQTGLRPLPSGEVMISKFDDARRQQLERLPGLRVSRETYTDIYYQRQPTAREVAWADQLASLQQEIDQEEEDVRRQLSDAIRQRADDLAGVLAALGQLDLLLAQVRLADQLNCVAPELVSGDRLQISFIGARHPQVEQDLAQQGRRFQPVSLTVCSGVTLITGANMGGKTVSLRLIGLLTAMAQYGLLLPAQAARLSLVGGIRLVAGEYRADTPGLSRFGAEVESLLAVLPATEQRCLLLYDELASSTNPLEGAALAQAVVEHLLDRPSISVFTTHYAELTRLAGVSHWQVVGLSRVHAGHLAEVVHDQQRSWNQLADLMDYDLQPVPAGQPIPREALRVGQLLGLPEGIIRRAIALIENRT
ncbi:MAG: MutS-related protein [Bacillota bacterium]|jgi:DNA mismatch repair protein MutS2